MHNKSYFGYIVSFLAILVPVPGRFVYGITLMMLLLLQGILISMISSLTKKIQLSELTFVLELFILVAFTILYRQIIIIICPEVALTLGFAIYLVPVSSFILNFTLDDKDLLLKERLKNNIKILFIYFITGILFFLFRDIACYGTFTFFGPKHQIFEKLILNPQITGIFSFCATIPGALILCATLLLVYISIFHRFNIIKNAEEHNAAN